MKIEELRFLIAEDHDFQRRALVRILTGLGARHIAEAGDGKAPSISSSATSTCRAWTAWS